MALNKVAKKWVAALRSGETGQTKNQLGQKWGTRCCLGVLCDLAVKAKVIDHFDIEDSNLPEEVKDWAGLRTCDGDYKTNNGLTRDLTQDNDRDGKSFKQIADIIESKPEGLFA